jgi:hypothetical protein
MVVVVPGDAAPCQGPQFLQEVQAEHDQGRENLFQDVAVVLDQQPQVLAKVMTDQLHFHPGQVQPPFHRLLRQVESNDYGQRQQVSPP